MYYKDLTYYSHLHFENALNIGWVKNNKSSDCSDWLDCLLLYVSHPINMIRSTANVKKLSVKGSEYTLGYSEIRVLSEDGNTVYACPDLIVASILEGGYCPPEVFIEAVKNGPKPLSKKYADFILYVLKTTCYAGGSLELPARY